MGNKGKTTHTGSGVYGAIKYECTERHSKWIEVKVKITVNNKAVNSQLHSIVLDY